MSCDCGFMPLMMDAHRGGLAVRRALCVNGRVDPDLNKMITAYHGSIWALWHALEALRHLHTLVVRLERR